MEGKLNRVDQIDALMIDDELKNMLFSQLLKIFDFFPQQLKIKYEDELRLILVSCAFSLIINLI